MLKWLWEGVSETPALLRVTSTQLFHSGFHFPVCKSELQMFLLLKRKFVKTQHVGSSQQVLG